MSKIQIDSGRSSAATHRLTQASTTLNRRYVRRPSNIAVDEAAQAAAMREKLQTPRAAPSRLVNLGVRTADLEKAKAAEKPPKLNLTNTIEESSDSVDSEVMVKTTNSSIKTESTEPCDEPEVTTIVTPNIVELGRPDNTDENNVLEEISTSINQATSHHERSAVDEPDNLLPSSIPKDINESNAKTQNIAPDVTDSALSLPESTQVSPILQDDTNTITDSIVTPEPPEVDTASLAMSIAADYAATSLGMSIKEYGDGHDNYAMNNPSSGTIAEQYPNTGVTNYPSTDTSNDSVEAIALAASNAIASIREATEPDQVSEQISSLKNFADNIKSNPNMPEMRELGDTIDKFVNIAMKSSKVQEENERKVAAKVTLSPKVTRAAAKVTKSSAKVMAANNRTKARAAATKTRTNNAKSFNASSPVTRSMTPRSSTMPAVKRPSSQQIKSHAIESALHSVATMEDRERSSTKNKKISMPRKKTSAKRFIIAFSCAAACIVAVIGFVGSNIPDISVRVAAMQTGIQASYPSYIPRDYSLGDISSEDGKITMIFRGPNNTSFKLIEEKSSWDSSALLRNYVEPSWNDNYATTHEQGITIYISNSSSDAAWVNGGVLYKIASDSADLTKKQIRSIVTSM